MNHLPSDPPTDLIDLSVRDFLTRLGSASSAPGGGAAAALVGALGAALVEMTANLTVGRPKYAAVEEDAQRLLRAAAGLREQLAALVQADASAFEAVSAAYRLPKSSEDEKARRNTAIQAALEEATNVPLAVATACAEVLGLAEEARPILNPTVISDVVVGGMLAQTGLESAAQNVEENTDLMKDRAAADRFSGALAVVRDGTAERVQALRRGRRGD